MPSGAQQYFNKGKVINMMSSDVGTVVQYTMFKWGYMVRRALIVLDRARGDGVLYIPNVPNCRLVWASLSILYDSLTLASKILVILHGQNQETEGRVC
jgi:hypothetical protein